MGNGRQIIDDYAKLSPQVKTLRENDPIFDELISDYLTLLHDLRSAESQGDTNNNLFIQDARESLRALDLEIREKLSRAEKVQNK